MTDAQVQDLDPALIGQILINSVAAASALGHKRLASTLRDYVDCDDDSTPPESRFVRDAITRPVAEVVAEWYGGSQNASALAQDVAFGDLAAGKPARVRCPATSKTLTGGCTTCSRACCDEKDRAPCPCLAGAVPGPSLLRAGRLGATFRL
jgi:hypothetical protein